MRRFRRLLTTLLLACGLTVAAPPKEANAIIQGVLIVAGGSAATGAINWLGQRIFGIENTTGQAFDLVGQGIRTVGNGAAALTEYALGRGNVAADALRTTSNVAGGIIQGAGTVLSVGGQTLGALVGITERPDPDNIAARAIAFSNGPPILGPFVRAFVDTASEIGQRFGTRIAAEILTLLNYVFLIWLLLQIAQMMLGMARGSEIFWNIVKRGAIYMILVAMLVGVQSGEYWRWFVQEPLQATSNLTQAMAAGIGGQVASGPGCQAPIAGNAGASAEAIACTTERVLRGGIAAGWTLIAATPFRITSAADMPVALANILAGVGLCIFFGLAMIYFGFFVIDVFLRVLVLAMFSPIFIGLYLIQATRGVTRNAINNLIGSFFTLLGSVAVLSIVGALIARYVGTGGTWDALIREYATRAVNLDRGIGIGDANYWTLAFAALTLVGAAKAIGGLMGGVFGGAAASTTADKATSIAALPVKAAASGAILAGGGLLALGGRAVGGGLSAAGSMAARKINWGR